MFQRTGKLILCLAFTALAACAGSNRDDGTRIRRSQTLTGATNDQGVPYTTGGDKRPYQDFVEDENKPRPDTPAPQPTEPAAPKKTELKDRLREFQISRFAKGEAKSSRFGDDAFSLKVFFKSERTVEFKGALTGAKPALHLEKTAGGYTISGDITDETDFSKSVFVLEDHNTGEKVKIYYRAYKATLDVQADRTKPIVAGSKFEAQLNFLKLNTFAWVQNWVVEDGISFFLNDIVKKVWISDSSPVDLDFKPILTFGGESLQTGNEDHPEGHTVFIAPDPEHPDQVSPGGELLGNGEATGERLITVTLPDEDNTSNKEGNTILLDVGPDPTQPVKPAEPDLEPTPEPEPQQPDTPATPTGKEFLKLYSSTRAALMAKHLKNNKDLAGVVNWKARLKTGNEKGDAHRFFKMANPIRAIVNAVSAAYDMAPVYFYITYAESRFFKEDKASKAYVAQWAPGSNTHALGPYQFQPATAEQDMGMRVTSSQAKTEEIKLTDERAFFVPSVCGAAGYLAQLTKNYADSDMTVGLLGYHEGGQGARNLVASAQSIATKYGKSYAKMSETSVLSGGLQDYVNKILAMYFLGMDPAANGFELGDKPMPSKNMFPPKPIKNDKCRAAVAAFQ